MRLGTGLGLTSGQRQVITSGFTNSKYTETDGSDEYITTTFNPNDKLGSNPFSISLWAKGGSSGFKAYCGSREGTHRFYFGAYDIQNVLVALGGTSKVTTNNPLDNTNWHLIIITYDRGGTNDCNVYVDDIETPCPLNGTFGLQTYADYNILLASYHYSDLAYSHWLGDLDEIFIYNKVLSQAERGILKGTGNTPETCGDGTEITGCVAGWRMGDKASWNAGTGTWTFPDQSGNESDGISQNMEYPDVKEF